MPADVRDALAVSRLSLRDLRQRRVRTVQVYATNRCNSRCLHCYVWQYKDGVDLPVAVVEGLLRANSIEPDADFCVEGGEITLHPERHSVLAAFEGRRTCVVTNGLLTDRAVELARRAPFATLMVSLDGSPSTYARLRGVDSHARVVETIRQARELVHVVVNFTFTPWNGADDYRHVADTCGELGVELAMPGVYTPQPYFRTVEPPVPIAGKHEAVPTRDRHQRRYLDLHDRWLRGEKRLPCFSIFRSALVYPDGDVYFCHQRKALLGNLHQRSFDAIWGAPESRAAQDAFLHCNDCWCAPHRLQDVYAEPLGRVVMLGRRMRERLGGR
ncbi:MAG: radical SAM protein [Vicinamibacteria bacterium]|nr:radical SAM protein [Vicinamibacteria bacterium]